MAPLTLTNVRPWGAASIDVLSGGLSGGRVVAADGELPVRARRR